MILNEVTDVSMDEDLYLDYKDDGEFYSIAAIVTFMKRELQRVSGFYEVVVPSYSIDEFRSHFQMTRNTFEVLTYSYIDDLTNTWHA